MKYLLVVLLFFLNDYYYYHYHFFPAYFCPFAALLVFFAVTFHNFTLPVEVCHARKDAMRLVAFTALLLPQRLVEMVEKQLLLLISVMMMIIMMIMSMMRWLIFVYILNSIDVSFVNIIIAITTSTATTTTNAIFITFISWGARRDIFIITIQIRWGRRHRRRRRRLQGRCVWLQQVAFYTVHVTLQRCVCTIIWYSMRMTNMYHVRCLYTCVTSTITILLCFILLCVIVWLIIYKWSTWCLRGRNLVVMVDHWVCCIRRGQQRDTTHLRRCPCIHRRRVKWHTMRRLIRNGCGCLHRVRSWATEHTFIACSVSIITHLLMREIIVMVCVISNDIYSINVHHRYT